MSKNYAKTVIAIACGEVGYLEKKTNKNLESKTANAGYNNFTKYAKELDGIKGFYNGSKNGYSWCAVFVDWCMYKAFGEKAMKKLTHHTELGASCTFSAREYQKNKRWYDLPKVGDEIFFGSTTNCSHTGLVYKIDDKFVYTIEGNTSTQNGVIANGGGVCQKKYALNSSSIAGYGRPKYDTQKLKGYTGTFPVLPSKGYLENGDRGTQVKRLQKFLNWYGASLDVDGIYGARTKQAVKEFQTIESLEIDGIFGAKSLIKAKAVKK